MTVNAEILENLSTNAQFVHEYAQRCVSLGIGIVPSPENPLDTKIIPSSMVPRSFKKELYYSVCQVNPLFNQLIDRITSDVDFLLNIHKGTLPIHLLIDVL